MRQNKITLVSRKGWWLRRYVAAHSCRVVATIIASYVFVSAAAVAQGAALPDFSGLWQLAEPRSELQPVNGTAVPLQPAARKRWQRNVKAMKAGKNSFDLTKRCLPAGLPRSMLATLPFKIVQSQNMLAMLFDRNHFSRWVYIDREHFEPLGPSYFGQSVARWEGQSLVIDTTDFKAETLLDESGLPHSDNLHIIERITLTASGQLEDRLTIDDPKTFSRQWETVLLYAKVSGDRVPDDDWCLGSSGLLGDIK